MTTLIALVLALQDPTHESLQAEIAALKPSKHAWREIAWVECPLEALKRARDEKKPILAWVFLGYPSNERC